MVTKARRFEWDGSQIEVWEEASSHPVDLHSNEEHRRATGDARRTELLILIEAEDVQNVSLTVDQHDAPAVNHALQVARKPGELIFAIQRQSLSFILNVGR